MKEDQIRVLNEQGNISIPVDIQIEIGVRGVELPRFKIQVDKEPSPHIALYPLDQRKDNGVFL